MFQKFLCMNLLGKNDYKQLKGQVVAQIASCSVHPMLFHGDHFVKVGNDFVQDVFEWDFRPRS